MAGGDWNYGQSPAMALKRLKFPAGLVEVQLEVEGGVIKAAKILGTSSASTGGPAGAVPDRHPAHWQGHPPGAGASGHPKLHLRRGQRGTGGLLSPGGG